MFLFWDYCWLVNVLICCVLGWGPSSSPHSSLPRVGVTVGVVVFFFIVIVFF